MEMLAPEMVEWKWNVSWKLLDDYNFHAGSDKFEIKLVGNSYELAKFSDLKMTSFLLFDAPVQTYTILMLSQFSTDSEYHPSLQNSP